MSTRYSASLDIPGTPSRYARYGKYGVSSFGHLTNGETLASFLVQILTKPLCSLKGSLAIKSDLKV